MTESITVIRADGSEHDLDECVQRGVDGIDGLVVVPAKRGGNLVVPGSHGELHIPAKKYQANSIVLQMWVRGVDPDGTIPDGADARTAFLHNLRALINLFVEDEQITLRHTLDDGTQREIFGEVTDSIAPDISGFGRYSLGQFTVALNCADPFWRDVRPVSQFVPAGSPVPLTAFAGATAPMEDLILEFGPQNSPRLEQPSTEIFVGVNRDITSGQAITVDTQLWTVNGSVGVAAGLYEDLVYGGRGTTRWFALMPEPGGGAPVVELTNNGGTGSVDLTGKRRYKIA